VTRVALYQRRGPRYRGEKVQGRERAVPFILPAPAQSLTFNVIPFASKIPLIVLKARSGVW
jgi:hypothetical protein